MLPGSGVAAAAALIEKAVAVSLEEPDMASV